MAVPPAPSLAAAVLAGVAVMLVVIGTVVVRAVRPVTLVISVIPVPFVTGRVTVTVMMTVAMRTPKPKDSWMHIEPPHRGSSLSVGATGRGERPRTGAGMTLRTAKDASPSGAVNEAACAFSP